MDTAYAASNEPRVCPFLHTVTEDGTPRDPILWPDPTNRCMALGDAAPQSLRQQDYACLASSHVNCPRFQRGGLAMLEGPSVRSGIELTPAIAGALLVLAASFVLSLGFVVANGGMILPGVDGSSPLAVNESTAPAASSDAADTPGSATPTIEPSAEASAQASPDASVQSATSAPSVAPSSAPPTATPTPGSSSDRYALLTPCPDAADCWVYVIRSGDNLVSIARYFGVPLDDVYERNPWTRTTGLLAGQELRLPPPTR